MWEEHLKHEFSTKNTEQTIKTMVRSSSHNACLHMHLIVLYECHSCNRVH